MARQSPEAPARPDAPIRLEGSAALLQGLTIPYGRHLCAFYDSTSGCEKLAIPFLRDGLARGDRCFVVADRTTHAAILDRLRPSCSRLDVSLTDGTLALHAPTRDPRDTLAYFREAFAAATLAGCRGLRVLGDMAAFTTAGAELDALVEFEADFDRTLAHKYPVVSLCQYDARAFSGVAMLRALEVHGDLHEYPLRYFLGA